MIETLLAAFAFGTFWFWLLAVIASVIIIACVENEHYPTPSIVAILLGIVYWKSLVALPWSVIALVAGGYGVAGAVWAVVQWFRRTKNKEVYYNEKYGTVLTESQMESLKSDLSQSKHKALITGWIAFWPWDLFWTLTGDFFNMIYDALAGVFQHISNRSIKKFSVKQPEEKKEVITNDEVSYRRGNRYA